MPEGKGQWGGGREGAGRKPIQRTEPTQRTTITLTESDALYLRQLGKGSPSKGLREALRRLAEYEALDRR